MFQGGESGKGAMEAILSKVDAVLSKVDGEGDRLAWSEGLRGRPLPLADHEQRLKTLIQHYLPRPSVAN